MEVLIILVVVGVGAYLMTAGSAGTGFSTGPASGGLPPQYQSADQIAMYATNAGFSGNDAVIAVAVALAESGGNANAMGDNNTSVGLWQIHTTAHPEFAGWNLRDPQTNANAAFRVYTAAGGTFVDWTTYNSGKSGDFLSQATSAVSGVAPMYQAQLS